MDHQSRETATQNDRSGGATSRLLSARLLSLAGDGRALDRLVLISDFLSVVESSLACVDVLAARAWRIVPLFERREVPAADTELATVAMLVRRMNSEAWIRGVEFLRTLRPILLAESPDAEARAAFVAFVADALRNPAPHDSEPHVLVLLAEACCAVGDPGVSELGCALAVHWGHALSVEERDAWTFSRSLGSLAASAGRPEDAERHLGEALKHVKATAAPALLPLTQHGCAALLSECNPRRARHYLDAAMQTYRQLDMRGDLERAAVLMRQLAEPNPTRNDPARCARMVLEGDYWTLEYQGRSIHVRDSKGLRDLSHLLQQPGHPVAAVELLAAADRDPDAHHARTEDVHTLAEEGIRSWRPSDLDAPDARALRAYGIRLREVREEIGEASRASDLGRSERLQNELDALQSELARECQPMRDRRGPFEKARKAVTKRIRGEIRIIGNYHGPLGQHLHEALKTGGYCTYSPREPVEWSIESPANGSTLPAR